MSWLLARALEDIADAGGDGVGRLEDGGVTRVDEHEVRGRQRPRQLPAVFRRPGAVVAAVHHDRGRPDAGQFTGQVEIALAGEGLINRLLAEPRGPVEEPGADGRRMASCSAMAPPVECPHTSTGRPQRVSMWSATRSAMAGMSHGPGSVSQENGSTATSPARARARGSKTAGEHIVPGSATITGSAVMRQP